MKVPTPKVNFQKGASFPKPLQEALKSSYRPTPNRYSVTTILAPVTQTILKRRHYDEIQEDVSDRMWALLGQGVHKVLETTDTPWLEKEIFIKIPVLDSTVSGVVDIYDPENKIISDWKTTSVWKAKNAEYDDYFWQLACYATMMNDLGKKVNYIQAIPLLRDHSSTKAKIEADYPDTAMGTVTWKFTPSIYMQTKQLMAERIKLIKEAEKIPDSQLPACSAEERWHEDDVWAVKKKGNKRALKRCFSQKEADAFIYKYMGNHKELSRDSFEIEFRQGADKRCESYCSVNKFCPYWKGKNDVVEEPDQTD